MNAIRRFLRKLRISPLWLAAALLGGLILHIGAVLAMAHLGANRGLAALTAAGPVNQMTVLDPVAAGAQKLPYMAPSERYAVCPFDLRRGPVNVHAVLGSDDWIVAIYGPTGANEYAVAGADLQRRDIDLLLAASDEGAGAPLPIAKGSELTTTVGLTARKGVVVISAPALRSSDADLADRLLGQAGCTERPRSSEGTN